MPGASHRGRGRRRPRTPPARRSSAPRPCCVRRSTRAGGGGARNAGRGSRLARPPPPRSPRRRPRATPRRRPSPAGRSTRAPPPGRRVARGWGSRSKQAGSWTEQSRFDGHMVLFLHNRYRPTGGEERVVEDLLWLVRERMGEQAQLLVRDLAQLGARRAALGLLRGGLSPADVTRAVWLTGARVVHAHNLQPALGWRALAAARAAGARVVLHLHQ